MSSALGEPPDSGVNTSAPRRRRQRQERDHAHREGEQGEAAAVSG